MILLKILSLKILWIKILLNTFLKDQNCIFQDKLKLKLKIYYFNS